MLWERNISCSCLSVDTVVNFEVQISVRRKSQKRVQVQATPQCANQTSADRMVGWILEIQVSMLLSFYYCHTIREV